MGKFMKILRKIAIILLFIGGICTFIFSINLATRNNQILEEIPCYIKEIKDIDIKHNTRSSDSIELTILVAYEREKEYVEEEIVLKPSTEKQKELVYGLEVGDTITLNNTIYGLSLNTHKFDIGIVIIGSFGLCLLSLILFKIDKEDGN